MCVGRRHVAFHTLKPSWSLGSVFQFIFRCFGGSRWENYKTVRLRTKLDENLELVVPSNIQGNKPLAHRKEVARQNRRQIPPYDSRRNFPIIEGAKQKCKGMLLPLARVSSASWKKMHCGELNKADSKYRTRGRSLALSPRFDAITMVSNSVQAFS